ncbi:MAG: PQQ-binding-like beta-propeller repeat protein [Phycisphaerae bacterium]
MFDTLGVVPILTNAGIAVLPAVLAGISSVVMQLLKPRETLALCRRKPHVPVIAGVVLAVAAGGIWWLTLSKDLAARTVPATVAKTDWTAVALQILREEKLAGRTLPAANTQPIPTPSAGAFNRRGNFLRNGHLGGPAPLGLQPLWEYKSEGSSYYLSDVAVDNGRIYTAGILQDLGTFYGVLTCLDARGQKIWEVTQAGKEPLKGFFSSPSLSADGKNLVIGQGLHTDKGCALMCFETATGKLLWSQKTPLNHIEGSPAVLGDLAVVGAGAIEDEQGKVAEGPGVVLAVRISTGERLWEYPVIDPEGAPAIADDGTVYIGSGVNGHAVVALRSETDAELKKLGQPRLLWTTKVDHPALGAVTLVGDKLLIGIGLGDFVKAAPVPAGKAVCLDRKTGTVLWQTPLGDAVLGAIAVVDDTAYAPVRSGELAALQLSDGKVLWRQAVSGKAPLLASPAVAGRYVYAVANDGTLAVLQRSDGKILETTQVNSPTIPGQDGFSVSSPVVVDGRLYVGSETGGLRCFVGGKETP